MISRAGSSTPRRSEAGAGRQGGSKVVGVAANLPRNRWMSPLTSPFFSMWRQWWRHFCRFWGVLSPPVSPFFKSGDINGDFRCLLQSPRKSPARTPTTITANKKLCRSREGLQSFDVYRDMGARGVESREPRTRVNHHAGLGPPGMRPRPPGPGILPSGGIP